jgi:hypothetical protein
LQKKINMSPVTILIADVSHIGFAGQICQEMKTSSAQRGTGIAQRPVAYIREKIIEGKAVIALGADGSWAGFCYIETWQSGEYVANSGLIVAPEFRNAGIARLIKHKIFELSQARYPKAKLFGLTTGLAVMKINSSLGYEPVTYSELTNEVQFWNGCQSCVNYPILQSKAFKNCLCTAMLFDPSKGTSNSAPLTSQEHVD